MHQAILADAEIDEQANEATLATTPSMIGPGKIEYDEVIAGAARRRGRDCARRHQRRQINRREAPALPEQFRDGRAVAPPSARRHTAMGAIWFDRAARRRRRCAKSRLLTQAASCRRLA
jgi:hypothetical protein